MIRFMKYYFLLLLLSAVAVQADVYRSVDKDGHVIFSDTAENNAEKIEIQQPMTYTAPVIIDLPEDEQPSSIEIAAPNYKVAITSPKQNETIRANTGDISINSTLSPALNGQRGDKLLFSLDGKLKGVVQNTTSYTFTNVDRGSHIAVVSVVDKTGKVIKSSKSVLFHLQRVNVH